MREGKKGGEVCESGKEGKGERERREGRYVREGWMER